MTKINDNSEITIPVRNLIAIIFFYKCIYHRLFWGIGKVKFDGKQL